MKAYVAIVVEVDGNIKDKEILRAHLQNALQQFRPHVQTPEGPVEITDAIVEEEEPEPITPEQKTKAQKLVEKLHAHRAGTPTPR